MISDAADLAGQAVGTGLETRALDLYGKLLGQAEEGLAAVRGSSPEQDTSVAVALLADAVLQGRAVLASMELTAAALDAARRSGHEEGFEEARRSSRRPGGGTGPRSSGRPALAAVSLRTA